MLLLLWVNILIGSSFENSQVKVELSPLYEQYEKNKTSYFALVFKMQPGWHIYWSNPADSGAAPKWNWKIKGGTFSTVHWPTPKRFESSGLINFGYEKQVIFPVEIKTDVKSNHIRLDVELEWLICKVECINGFTRLNADAKLGDKNLGPKTLLEETLFFLKSSPKPYPFLLKRSEKIASFRTYIIEKPKLPFKVIEVEIFPWDTTFFSAKKPTIDISQDLKFTLEEQGILNTPTDNRILIVFKGKSEVSSVVFYAPTESPVLDWRILLFAFLGGMILNIMPCVFPVLSIKVLSFSKYLSDLKLLRRSGWAYSLGVVVSFFLLGLLLTLLRASGEQLGWGFQLQSPRFVIFLCLVFFILALLFLGVAEVGVSFISWAGKVKQREGVVEAFLTGVLATLVATPCTAPLMGTALGASLFLPKTQTLIIFIFLGTGMAFPFLLLCYFTRLLKLLPKPGSWMVTFKELLAFPLLLTSVWLLWVLSLQVSEMHLFKVSISFVLVGFTFWILKKKKKYGALIIFVLSFVLPLYSVQPKKDISDSSSSWVAYQNSQVQEWIDKKESVFIDFTAAWCLTCQINKKTVLEKSDILELFKNNSVHLVRADWTHHDPQITQALSQYGRNSLPLYVYYPKNSKGEYEILPQILTPQMIKNRLK